MTDLLAKVREKLAFDSESFDVEVEGLNERGEVIITLDEEMVELMKYGMTAEHARTRAIVDALLKVAEAAENLERQCKLRGPFKMKDLSDAGDAMTKALRELSQAVGDDPAQKGG